MQIEEKKQELPKIKNIKPKYTTFKVELLSEYAKARKNYNSVWGRSYIASHTKSEHIGWKEVNFIIIGQSKISQKRAVYDISEMGFWHFLAVVIYCNCDTLQNAFSKTYRKIDDKETPCHVITRHSEFIGSENC